MCACDIPEITRGRPEFRWTQFECYCNRLCGGGEVKVNLSSLCVSPRYQSHSLLRSMPG